MDYFISVSCGYNPCIESLVIYKDHLYSVHPSGFKSVRTFVYVCIKLERVNERMCVFACPGRFQSIISLHEDRRCTHSGWFKIAFDTPVKITRLGHGNLIN